MYFCSINNPNYFSVELTDLTLDVSNAVMSAIRSAIDINMIAILPYQ